MATTTTASGDVHVRCLTPDLAASTFRHLKANNVHPVLLVGSLVVVGTDGTPAQVSSAIKAVQATGLVPAAGILGVRETPAHLRELSSVR